MPEHATETNPLARLSWPGLLQLASRPFGTPLAKRRFLIGLVVALVPILGLFVLWGYTVRITRSVLDGEAEPLPDWGDRLGLFLDAVRVVVVYFVLSLPADLMGTIAEASGGGIAGAGISVIAHTLSLVLEILAWLIVPLAMMRLAANEFGPAFAMRSHWRRIQRRPRAFLNLAILVVPTLFILSSFALLGSLMWVPGIGNMLGPFSFTYMAVSLLLTVWCLCTLGAATGLAGQLMSDPPAGPDSEPQPGVPR